MDDREHEFNLKTTPPEVSERYTSHSNHHDDSNHDTNYTGETTYTSDGTQYGYYLDEPDVPVEEKRDRRGESVWYAKTYFITPLIISKVVP